VLKPSKAVFVLHTYTVLNLLQLAIYVYILNQIYKAALVTGICFG